MGKFHVFFWLLISFSANALEVGDILLQPLKCWSCTLIEQQENSDFSHMGIYMGEGKVAEAYFDKVKLVELKEFLKKTDLKRAVLVRRLQTRPDNFESQLKAQLNKFLGLPYDRWFLWDDDKIYCSELVYKMLSPVVELYDLKPKLMLFDRNPEYWDRYFRGQTPRGKLGISPADFDLSSDFVSVDTIDYVRH